MAGHNKWSSIKHKKAKTDAQKGKVFSKVSREIIVAVRLAGADPDTNGRLRLALQKAKEANMPNDNVKRAIQKGEGSANDTQYEEITFEAYGQHGVGLLIETLTDNRNRTVATVKHILSRNNGSLATKGAVQYQFNRKALFLFPTSCDEDELTNIALEFDIDDIDNEPDNGIIITASPEDFDAINSAFIDQNIHPESARVEWVSDTTIPLSSDQAQSILNLMDSLEDDDDIQNVASNFSIQ